MKTCVVLRTDGRNTEILYRKIEGLSEDGRRNLIQNLSGLSRLINKKHENLFLNLLTVSNTEIDTFYLNVPYDNTYYHKLITGCGDPDCTGTSCSLCNLDRCEVCGGSESDLYTHCIGRRLTIEEIDYSKNFKGGIWIDNTTLSKWATLKGLDIKEKHVQQLYKLEQSIDYIDKLRLNYASSKDFLESIFLFEELLKLSSYITYKVDTKNEVSDKVIKLINYSTKLIQVFLNHQSSIKYDLAESRKYFSRYKAFKESKYLNHNILTRASYEDGTIDKELVNLIRKLNKYELEVASCSAGSKNSNNAYILFHPNIKAKNIIGLWGILCKGHARMDKCLRLESSYIKVDAKIMQRHKMYFTDDVTLRSLMLDLGLIDTTRSYSWSEKVSIFSDYLSRLIENHYEPSEELYL